jgi:hypothetical protein
MNVKSASGDVSDENKEHAIRNWGKDNPCYKLVENLAQLCSSWGESSTHKQ